MHKAEQVYKSLLDKKISNIKRVITQWQSVLKQKVGGSIPFGSIKIGELIFIKKYFIINKWNH